MRVKLILAAFSAHFLILWMFGTYQNFFAAVGFALVFSSAVALAVFGFLVIQFLWERII